MDADGAHALAVGLVEKHGERDFDRGHGRFRAVAFAGWTVKFCEAGLVAGRGDGGLGHKRA